MRICRISMHERENYIALVRLWYLLKQKKNDRNVAYEHICYNSNRHVLDLIWGFFLKPMDFAALAYQL